MLVRIFVSCLVLVISSAQDTPYDFQPQYDGTVMARLDQLEAKVLDQELQLNSANDQINSLKEQVQRLESVLLVNISNNLKSRITEDKTSKVIGVSPYSAIFSPRTCLEARDSGLPEFKESGMYWIDPDGIGIGDGAIYVHCDMKTGTTSLGHDSEETIEIPKCTDPGCYSRSILYQNTTAKQAKALAEFSAECHQTIQVNCLGGPFTVEGIDYAWWNDVDGEIQTFWSGSDATVHTCQCGIDDYCVRPDLECNCDANVAVPLSDNGKITLKNVLPVTKLNFGRTIHNGGSHTLGKLICSGKSISPVYPRSCADLWRIGYTLNGLYPIQGDKHVEFVHCDFTLGQNVAQNRIGYVDVKSEPVQFYVQSSTSISVPNKDSPIIFNVTVLNEGGAMDISTGIFTAPKSGTYLFDFSGVSEPSTGVFSVVFYVNGVQKGSSFADDLRQFTVTLPSIWHLNKGDEVKLSISPTVGTLFSNNLYGPLLHFTGILLEEEIFTVI
ncbi:uncharacterized protein LOC124207781 isoform X2 [Daphnia pulex]|uniref:uncharacterized protein LOC124207781 isoform X2 n=1 Tax=Daphnia pulex TaxID=6669 RepID=UPI001EDF4C22|nr:uncharacterized protein LOC124207781 isoform X2 [Daphnia pulex]